VKQKGPKSPPAAEGELKGWTAIARYLGIPVATAHRWASEGMPVRREGRFTVADREAVSACLHPTRPEAGLSGDPGWARIAHAEARARNDQRLRPGRGAQRVDCCGAKAEIKTKSHRGDAEERR